MTAPTVFIVDDDAPVRDSLAMLLELKGFHTRTLRERRGVSRAVPRRVVRLPRARPAHGGRWAGSIYRPSSRGAASGFR